MASRTQREAASGAAFGLAAAATFGLSAPLAKLLLDDASPLALAGLLYAGGGLGLGLAALARGAPARTEAQLRRADLPWLLGAIALGGIAGPVLMLFGFARISGVAGALLLNLEAPLTALVATLVFREHLGRRGALALALILLGALLLASPAEGQTDPLGAVAVGAACLCWGLENNLITRLALRDPWAVARAKMLGAAACNLALARAVGAAFPSLQTLALALAVGAVSYGASNVLNLRALRIHGAARQAAFFATAPFLGALAAVPLLRERPAASGLLAATLMAAGVLLMVLERHSHRHAHAALEHDHAHSHDDPHHGHVHDPPVSGTHAHPHRHEATTHAHPHLPDEHHRHEHG